MRKAARFARAYWAGVFAPGVLAFGQNPAAWLAALARMPDSLGLAGQLGFALIPW